MERHGKGEGGVGAQDRDVRRRDRVPVERIRRAAAAAVRSTWFRAAASKMKTWVARSPQGSSEGVAADEAASASSAFDGEQQRSTASGVVDGERARSEVSAGSEESVSERASRRGRKVCRKFVEVIFTKHTGAM
jgi:hypothetical protein